MPVPHTDPVHSPPDEDRITYFAFTDSRGKRIPFGIKREDRSRHAYVIGKTGMGKSTLLENMAIQDIQNGEGLCFIDPHGGTAEKLLEYVPEHRIKDVLYFAPFDLLYPISFNVLESVDVDKRHFVVAGLMSAFEKIWVDAWSARMAYILQNTLGALLEFPGASLLGVNRMYIDKDYRKAVIAKVTDSSIKSFWVDEYSKYTDRYTQEATPAIQNKIGQFASNALVRNIIGQSESAFDIRKLMDEKKIFIVNLSKGRVGEGNANLLGSMLITKIYLAAMSRADAPAPLLRKLPPFFLYVDEFQNFANRSFAGILSEARKYKLSLTIAHQYIEQMEEEVGAAVFGNVGTMMTFRVGAYDAEVLEKEFAPVFTADDLVNLGARQIYLKLMIDGISSQPFSAVTMPPIEEPAVSNRDRVIAFSRAQFARPREEVERDIKNWVEKKYEDTESADRKGAPRVDGERPRERNDRPQGARGSDVRRPDTRFEQRPPMTRVDRPRGNDAVRGGPPLQPRPPIRAPAQTSVRPRPPFPRAEERAVPAPGVLRDVLSQVGAAPAASVAASTPVRTPPHEVQAPKREEAAPPREKPPFLRPPVRDDGKSVTEAGKQELRNLLATLTSKGESSVSPAPSTQGQATRTEATASPAPVKPVAPQRSEPSRDELETMLRVTKPNIE